MDTHHTAARELLDQCTQLKSTFQLADPPWCHLPPLPTLRDSAGWKYKIMLRWSLLPPWAPAERGRTRVDLGKARALVTISVLQQSCVQWLNQEIFGRNERPRASAESSRLV